VELTGKRKSKGNKRLCLRCLHFVQASAYQHTSSAYTIPHQSLATGPQMGSSDVGGGVTGQGDFLGGDGYRGLGHRQPFG
jgi:hypothetical protein